MSEHKEMIKEVIKIRLRLKHGAKEELLPLLKLENIGRVRARKLFNAGIKDIRAVKKASAADLTQLLGNKIALSIKEQVGQKVKEIKKGARKGQTSIKKF
jgi:helicase